MRGSVCGKAILLWAFSRRKNGGDFLNWMKKAELELALKAAGQVARDSEFIVFGSQSIFGTIARPPKICMMSQEVDLYPRNHPQAVALVVDELGRRSSFARRNGFFVDCVSPDVAAFPDGWMDRLVPFRTKKTGGVTGWCIDLTDVACSKLAAGREKDLEYVRALLSARLLSLRVLKDRIAALPVDTARREEIMELIERLIPEAKAKRARVRKNK